MAPGAVLTPVGFDALPGWRQDGQAGAYEAFRRSALHAAVKPYRTGGLGIEAAMFEAAYRAARSAPAVSDDAARSFFETHFRPFRIEPEAGSRGFVTGFYEPEVEASPTRTPRFTVPLLSRPADLVDIDDANRPAGLDPYLAFGRAGPHGILEYHDRAAIDGGALAGQGLEIAWLDDPVDAYFIHVQGAARLTMPDGSVRRVTYAAKSGQRFTGAGHVLIEKGEMRREDVTMQSIRAWFRAHPDRVHDILWRNRSYIFFRDASVDDPALGPVAAAKVPLTPGRSMAVDRLIHTFGTPFFIHAPDLSAFGSAPFSRLMIAQDTGSAIVGPARGDLFAGSGAAAGDIAGVVRHEADVFILVPRGLDADRRFGPAP